MLSAEYDLGRILSTRSPFTGEFQDSFENTVEFLEKEVQVLVIGAGGLGCEILKCLALSGFRRITIVDMDTIEMSNLNRQFLFRDSDVGRAKAEVAAEFVNKRCGHLGVKVESRVCRIQELDSTFFSNFMIVVAGLDNIEARRWLNSTVHGFVQRDAEGAILKSSIRFLLDGGTEGLKGQARVIVPTMTACFECTLGTFPPVVSYPLCTIADTPRQPEHCVEYAMTVLFEKEFPGRAFNADNQGDIDWVFEQALVRSNVYKIAGVTKEFTKGVVKRIIPAVASTNALIAGVLANEAFKIATFSNPVMDNYFMYMGQTGINCETFRYEKNPDCLVCGKMELLLEINPASTLADLLGSISDKLFPSSSDQDSPALVCQDSGKVVYMANPESLRVQLEPRLCKTLSQLLRDGVLSDRLVVLQTSKAQHQQVTLGLSLTSNSS